MGHLPLILVGRPAGAQDLECGDCACASSSTSSVNPLGDALSEEEAAVGDADPDSHLYGDLDARAPVDQSASARFAHSDRMLWEKSAMQVVLPVDNEFSVVHHQVRASGVVVLNQEARQILDFFPLPTAWVS